MKRSVGILLTLLACSACDRSERMQGLWRNDFEGSQFCHVPAKTCGYVPKNERTSPTIWLDVADAVPFEFQRHHFGGLYAVDFIGRRHSFRGSYGHMGLYDEEIIVDRMISMKEIQAAPPPPTKAEMIEDWKKCEAAGTCFPNWSAINNTEE